MRHKFKRLVALVLALSMATSLLSSNVWASEAIDSADTSLADTSGAGEGAEEVVEEAEVAEVEEAEEVEETSDADVEQDETPATETDTTVEQSEEASTADNTEDVSEIQEEVEETENAVDDTAEVSEMQEDSDEDGSDVIGTQATVTYWDPVAKKSVSQNAEEFPSDALSSGLGYAGSTDYYYVSKTQTFQGRISIKGTVYIILQDGVTLNVEGGFEVASGKSLTIYSESNILDSSNTNVGKLFIDLSTYASSLTSDQRKKEFNTSACIGGQTNEDVGAITISGGDIELNAGTNGAAIGSGLINGDNINIAKITINGGKVTASTQVSDAIGKGVTASGAANLAGIEFSGGILYAYGGRAFSTLDCKVDPDVYCVAQGVDNDDDKASKVQLAQLDYTKAYVSIRPHSMAYNDKTSNSVTKGCIYGCGYSSTATLDYATGYSKDGTKWDDTDKPFADLSDDDTITNKDLKYYKVADDGTETIVTTPNMAGKYVAKVTYGSASAISTSDASTDVDVLTLEYEIAKAIINPTCTLDGKEAEFSRTGQKLSDILSYTDTAAGTTGELKKGLFECYDITVNGVSKSSGDAITTAGDYTIVLTPKATATADTNREYKDGNFTFTIAKKAISPDFGSDAKNKFIYEADKAEYTKITPTVTDDASLYTIVYKDETGKELSSAPTDVGKYSVELKLADSTNYTFGDTSHTTLSYEIVKNELGGGLAAIADVSYGTDVSASASVTEQTSETTTKTIPETAYTITYTGKDIGGKEYSSTIAPKNAGKYTATLAFKSPYNNSSNYDASGVNTSSDFAIEAKEVSYDLETGSKDKTYDNSGTTVKIKFSSAPTAAFKVIFTDTATGTTKEVKPTYSPTATEYTLTSPNVDSGTYSISIEPVDPTGEDYAVSDSGSDGSSASGADVFTIEPVELDVSGMNDETDEYSPSSSISVIPSVTVDGTTFEKYLGKDVKATTTIYDEDGKEVKTIRNAGTYTVKYVITGDTYNNYAITTSDGEVSDDGHTVTKTITIDKATPDVDVKETTYTYDAAKSNQDPTFVGTDATSVAHTVTYTNAAGETVDHITVPGTYTVNWTPTDTANYNIPVVETVTVEKATPTLTLADDSDGIRVIVGDTANIVDNADITVTGKDLSSNDLIFESNDTSICTVDAAGDDATVTGVKVSSTNLTATLPENDYYKAVTLEIPVYVVNNPGSVEDNTDEDVYDGDGNIVKVYGDEDSKIDLDTTDPDDWLHPETVDVTYSTKTGSVAVDADGNVSTVKAGNDIITVTLTPKDGYSCPDTVTLADGTTKKVTINKATGVGTFTINAQVLKKDLTITVPDLTINYGDDVPDADTLAKKVSLDGLIASDKDQVVYSTKATDSSNAGTYAINVSFKDPEVEKNYNIESSVGTLTISPVKLSVQSTTPSKEYGDTTPTTTTYTVKDASGKELTDATATFKYRLQGTNKLLENPNDVGTYDVILTGLSYNGSISTDTLEAGESGTTRDGNYEYVYTTGSTMTVGKIASNSITADDINLTYGGSSAAVGATAGAGTVEYDLSSLDKSVAIVDAATGLVTPIGAGSTTFKVRASGDSVTDPSEWKTVKVTVSPKPITVKVDDATKTYGENDPKFTYTVDGVVDGDSTPSVTLTRDKGVTAGTYTISPVSVNNPNYTIGDSENGTLTITKKSIAPAVVTFPQTSYDYTGAAITPTPTVKLDGVTLVPGTDYDVAYNNNVNEGTASVTITGKGNYEDLVGQTFTIQSPAVVTATVAVVEPYDDIEANSLALNSGILIDAPTCQTKKIYWGQVASAAGYDVYVSDCDNNFSDYSNPVATVMGSANTSVLISTFAGNEFDRNSNYKAYVQAFRYDSNGNKKIIGTSIVVHSAGKYTKYTDVTKVKVQKSSVTLKVGKTAKIKASVTKKVKSKKILDSSHNHQIRYISTNTSVATVSASGKITAKGKGTAKIYVIAQNGRKTTVKVTVK